MENMITIKLLFELNKNMVDKTKYITEMINRRMEGQPWLIIYQQYLTEYVNGFINDISMEINISVEGKNNITQCIERLAKILNNGYFYKKIKLLETVIEYENKKKDHRIITEMYKNSCEKLTNF